MAIQEAVNQAMTGATFLIQQSPYYQTLASRQAGKKAFQKAEAIQQAGREEIVSALRDISKEVDPNDHVGRAKYAAEQAQASAALERKHAEEVKKMRGYEPEAVAAEKTALHAESRAKRFNKLATEADAKYQAQADELARLHMSMYEEQAERYKEAELSRLQSEEFRKRVFEGIYRKGERL